MIDVMLSDLPRVIYIDKDKITKQDIEDAEKKTKDVQERVRKGGLGINFSAKVNPQNFIKSKMK